MYFRHQPWKALTQGRRSGGRKRSIKAKGERGSSRSELEMKRPSPRGGGGQHGSSATSRLQSKEVGQGGHGPGGGFSLEPPFLRSPPIQVLAHTQQPASIHSTTQRLTPCRSSVVPHLLQLGFLLLGRQIQVLF